MALSDMKVFNEYLKATTIETLDQMVDKFNAASRGAIVLTTQGVDGDYLQEAFWQSVHSARRRVDRYAAQGAAANTDMSQEQANSVKVAGAFGPVAFEPSQLTWMQQNPAEAIEMASRNMAEAIVQDQLNTGIAAARAAISANTAMNVAMAGTDATHADLNNAHALFGDHSSTIVADVMDGTSFHAIIGANLTNSENLYQSNGVLVVDILGKAIVVTDAPALRDGVVQNDETSVLCLVAGGIVISGGSDLVTNIETTNGQTRIESTLQADYSFVCGLKGFAWDIANGGASPDDAALALGTNWDQVATSDKHTAGTRTFYTVP
jgi:hypothetical protein